MIENLVIRADASEKIGIGHIMRCLALGQAWRDIGGKIIFITTCKNESLLKRLGQEGFCIHLIPNPFPDPSDWNYTKNIINNNPNTWVILDGYHFDESYQKKIKNKGQKLLVIDDIAHLKHYYADILLNQNLYAKELNYNCEPSTKLLLGTKYVLLRRDFLEWRGWKRKIPQTASKLLVTLGGSDPGNVTLKVIQALQKVKLDRLESVTVVGGSNSNYKELNSAVHDSKFQIRLEVNAINMPELMAWADAAISSAGITSWELAFMGLPSLILILADNQYPVAESLHTNGVAVNLGGHKNLSLDEIAQLVTQFMLNIEELSEKARNGRDLVDGEGVSRVLMHIKGDSLRLRPVQKDDCKLVWEWANDPEVRASSFSSDSIPWEHHLQWFKSTIKDPNCIFYIGINNKEIPIGQVRYSIENKDAVISISIDRGFRRKGYGTSLIRLSSQRLFYVSDVTMIHGYVKQGNELSIGAFIKSGFKIKGAKTVRGNQAIHLILKKG